ncbi:hypothetical protein [Fretibacter rubidus]
MTEETAKHTTENNQSPKVKALKDSLDKADFKEAEEQVVAIFGDDDPAK